jgi:hypothetical protein
MIDAFFSLVLALFNTTSKYIWCAAVRLTRSFPSPEHYVYLDSIRHPDIARSTGSVEFRLDFRNGYLTK